MTPKPPTGSRDVALGIVRDVFGPGHRRAQEALDYRTREAELSPRDRAFVAQLAYGAIKMRRTLDWYLAPYVGKRIKTLPPPILEALRLGVYQLRYMGGVDEHAAVFETVNAARHVGHRGTAGLVNAVLRGFIKDAPGAPEREAFGDDDNFLGTAYSLPTWIVARLRERLDGALEQTLAGLDDAPQVALRVNLLRGTPDDALERLREMGVAARRSELVADALILDGHAHVPIADELTERWALQGESACIPVDVLDPRPGERILDLCSGRGNKAIQAGARMNDAGTLTCVERDPAVATVLERRLGAAGISIAAVVRGDATQYAAPPEGADGVLVDAPCSGLGVLGRHPEARWRKEPEDGARHAGLQAALLRSGAAATRADGRLVYAVCSVDRRECEDVVEPFLAEHAEFRRAGFPERYATLLTAAGDVVIPPGLEGRDGFYVASLIRSP